MKNIQTHTRKFFRLFTGLSLVCASSRAVELDSLFSDNVVLQQNKPLPIWGAGRDGEKITVKLGERTATVSGGKWSVRLNALLAARYNWASVAEGNLCNAADLPASPFRTDVEPDGK